MQSLLMSTLFNGIKNPTFLRKSWEMMLYLSSAPLRKIDFREYVKTV